VEEVVQRTTEVRKLPAPRKRKILVTGLLPQQAGIIQQEFNDCFTVEFWNDRNGDGFDRLKALGRSCECVFMHIAHASHKVKELLEAVGATITPVNGGMTQMREAITAYYVKATS
jgi:hypothetical protein